MNLKQNDRERLLDLTQQGVLTPDEANVKKVQCQRVLLVRGRIPAQVRRALNAAVKNGQLGHYKKNGHEPEAYFHPNFAYMARDERRAHALRIKTATLSVQVPHHNE